MTTRNPRYGTYDLSNDLAGKAGERDIDVADLYSYIDHGASPAPLLLSGAEQDQTIVAAEHMFKLQILGLVDVIASERQLKPSVADWLKASIAYRIDERTGCNSVSYQKRIDQTPNISRLPDHSIEDVLEACHNSRVGTASIAQSRLAQIAYGIPAMELGDITIVGDYRKEFEPDLWNGVSELVGRDVSDFRDGVYRTKIVGFDRPIDAKTQHIGAIRVGTKRLIERDGEYDSTIKGRQMVVIDTSPSSDFPPKLASLLREAYRYNQNLHAKNETLQARGEPPSGGIPFILEELPPFMEYLEYLRSISMNHSVVLARNETVYCPSEEFTRQAQAKIHIGGCALHASEF